MNDSSAIDRLRCVADQVRSARDQAALTEQFMIEIEPYLKIKRDIFNCALPTFILTSDGRIINAGYDMTDAQKAMLANADDAINLIHKKMFGPKNDSNS